MAFGRVGGLGGIPWFGLPGNPVSTLVTFEVFVRPALLRMCGRRAVFSPVEPARLAGRVSVKPGLTNFLRVRLDRGEVGLVASLTGSQSSGVLTSMAAADGLLVVPESGGDFQAGDTLPVIVLGGAPLREEAGY
jgi:molybdopterin molybdotransferase